MLEEMTMSINIQPDENVPFTTNNFFAQDSISCGSVCCFILQNINTTVGSSTSQTIANDVVISKKNYQFFDEQK